jgi:hypothetical protein
VLPLVLGNVDYQRFERRLSMIEQVIMVSGVESLFVKLNLEALLAVKDKLSVRQRQRFEEHSRLAVAARCSAHFDESDAAHP